MPSFSLIEISSEPIMPNGPTAFELPPVPALDLHQTGYERFDMEEYGHACRAPLLARIAELERSFDELAAAVGWTKERCDQDGDAPVDVANRLRAEVEALRADAKASAPPKEKPEFLEWVATELSASGALDRAVAQGVAETLRGQAFLLRAIAALKGEGSEG